jgi:hypothetical protein
MRQEDLEFEASLGYIDPVSIKQNKAKQTPSQIMFNQILYLSTS